MGTYNLPVADQIYLVDPIDYAVDSAA